MEISRTIKPGRNMADVSVWHCGGCDVVHIAVGKLLLNFTRAEFTEFTEAVVDIDARSWTNRSHSIVDLVEIDQSHGLDIVH